LKIAELLNLHTRVCCASNLRWFSSSFRFQLSTGCGQDWRFFGRSHFGFLRALLPKIEQHPRSGRDKENQSTVGERKITLHFGLAAPAAVLSSQKVKTLQAAQCFLRFM
jgi:hypothetical protein